MKRQLTAIIEREGNGYVSLCPELDIASQGETIEDARDNLREALELFFETASREEIQARFHEEVYVTPRGGGRWVSCVSVSQVFPGVNSNHDRAPNYSAQADRTTPGEFGGAFSRSLAAWFEPLSSALTARNRANITTCNFEGPSMPESINSPTESGPMPERHLQDIFNNAPIGIFTSTPEGRCISANPALARMFGYESPEALIASITDIADADVCRSGGP
jgi:PAS domain-containing protein